MQRLKDAAMDSSAGKFVGKKLAKNSGVAVTDSKGEVYYDPNKDESTWAGKMTAEDKKFRANLPGGENYSPDIEGAVAGGVVPVKIVDGLDSDPKIQGAAENSQDQTEALAESVSDQTEATTEDTKVTKETIKQDKAQKRQARAGKALGALGTATMVAGMATQVDGKVGEIAQQVVGPMAALSGIAPLLMALPAPIAALVAVIGLGVAGFLLYNKAMNKAYDETYELTRAMGTSTKAMDSFANFAGTVTSGEVLSNKENKDFLNTLLLQKNNIRKRFCWLRRGHRVCKSS